MNHSQFELHPSTIPAGEELLRQWQRTRRRAKIATWVLILTLIQIPPVSGFLVTVLHVSDDVGAAYALCTVLLLLIGSVFTAVYRISAAAQMKTLSRLFGIDPTTLALLIPQSPSANPTRKADLPAPIAEDRARMQVLQLEIKKTNALKWWLVISTLPPLFYTILLLLALAVSLEYIGWEIFILLISIQLLSWYAWVVVPPLYAVISCIIIGKARRRLRADFPDEYTAYRKKKKRTAGLQTVAVTLYGVMMILFSWWISSAEGIHELRIVVPLLLILSAILITLLCIRSRRMTRKQRALAQNLADHYRTYSNIPL